jgi:hypothetical protein
MRVKPPKILAPKRMPDAVGALEAELAQERAATLSRLTRAFEEALAAYKDYESAGRADRDHDADRECLRENAARALWAFVVQREACGLRNTEAVLREYEVPAALRFRMGAILR